MLEVPVGESTVLHLVNGLWGAGTAVSDDYRVKSQ